MAKRKSVNDLVGKTVQIYPGDSTSKFGIVEEISDHGVLFKITKVDSSRDSQYTVGSLHFISWSARLSFKEV